MWKGAVRVVPWCLCLAVVGEASAWPDEGAEANSQVTLDFARSLAELDGDSDVAFAADVSARELRFDIVPKTIRVTFTTPAGGRTVFSSIRHNLPTPVRAGVTYHDVKVRVVIANSLPALAELLKLLDQRALALTGGAR